MNEEIVGFPPSSDERDLVEPFCVTADGYFIFNLAINYASTTGFIINITPNISTRLYFNNEVVASSFVFDAEEPTNVALFWEGVAPESTEVKVTVQNGGGFNFGADVG